MDYELISGTYQGPIDKLLELIEEKKLEITQISLAEVTADFLRSIESLRARFEKEHDIAHEQLLADFLSVASKLLLIKSKALLPALILTEEEEADTKDLEVRLKLYQEFKAAERHIKSGWNEFPNMGAREFLATSEPLFYPPKGNLPSELHRVIRQLSGELEKIMRPITRVKTKVINLREKIEEILGRLTSKPLAFARLRGGAEKGELIVLFLALLHLIKDQLIHVEQVNHFDDMTVVKRQKS